MQVVGRKTPAEVAQLFRAGLAPRLQRDDAAGPIRSYRVLPEDDRVTVDDKRVQLLTFPDAAGAVPFAAGDVVEWLKGGEVPPMQAVEDPARSGQVDVPDDADSDDLFGY